MNSFFAEYREGLALLKRSRYLDFPREISIETATVCNAACYFCPYPSIERKGTKMADALVEKILADLQDVPRDLPFTISPFKVNDPLLDVRIFDIIAEINGRLPQASIRMFSNGSPLTAKNVGRLAKVEHLVHLWVSLNSHKPGRYEEIMQLPLARTLENLDALHASKAGGEFPHDVVVSKIREDTPDDDEFHRFVIERWPLFRIGIIFKSEWLGQVPGLESVRKVPLLGCARWFEMSITSTGVVAMCCMDGKAEHPIGDVSKTHVLEVYNNPEYRRFREKFITRMEGSPCMTCTHF